MIAFGPVPSRRLGRSLGVNNIPPKVCTYSCVYCQVGRTKQMQIERTAFYEPQRVLQEVADKVESSRKQGEPIDYLTFVPDGEPTLDVNLGREIELLRSLDIKLAIITNSSLISRQDVRDELMGLDWVSLKVDAVQEESWRKVNRPHGRLQLSAILQGMREFAASFSGTLVTETMLVRGLNDTDDHARQLAEFLAELRPAAAYLSIPVRPPAEEWVQVPAEETINRFYQIVSDGADHVEYLIGYEGNAFAFTGNAAEDILSITAVHPMREEAVDEFLAQADADWSLIDTLINEGKLLALDYEGHKFYLRRLGVRRGAMEQ